MAAIILRDRARFFVRNSLFMHSKLLFNARNYADDSTKQVNLYETLGIQPGATQNEIKKAYYDLTLMYHPDRSKNSPIAAEKFREVTEAYGVLSNYVMKKKYDMGVPLSTVMKTVKRAPIKHKVQYQSFYDSRAVPRIPKQDTEKDEEVSPQTKWVQECLKHDEEIRSKNSSVQAFLLIFLISFIYALSRGKLL